MKKTITSELPGEKTIKGNKHVLYKKIVPQMDIENPTVNQITLYLSTFFEDKVNLAEILNDLSEVSDRDKIKLRINSPGGLLNEGRALINSIHATGAEVTTEILSDAASMGALMFCIGNKRLIYENSTIMFHNFSGGYMGKGQEMEAYIKHSVKNNKLFFTSHLIGLSEKEVHKMTDGKDYWFNAKKMCERGIATHVIVHGLTIPAKYYLKLLKRVKKEAKLAYPKEKLKIKSLDEALIYGIDALTPLAMAKREFFDETQNQLTELLNNFDFDDIEVREPEQEPKKVKKGKKGKKDKKAQG